MLTLAGLFAGLTEAVVINPFEAVKVRLQAERQQFSQVRFFPGFLVCLINVSMVILMK